MLSVARASEAQPVPAVASIASAQNHAARRDLLYRLGNFLLDHELDVNPANLALAQAFVAGSNVELSRQIVARQLAEQPVTQAWLDDLSAELAPADDTEAREREALEGLTGKLEQALAQSLQDTGEVGADVSDYQAALSETAASLAAASPVVQLPELTRLTDRMIERTRSFAADLHRRGEEVAGLRDSLQLAQADAAVGRLTGMGSDRAFDQVLEREHRFARESGEPLSIAFCDIDRFEAITDMHGAETGDRVIQAIARSLRRIAGHSCHVSRHGGRKFALMFRGLTPEQVRGKLDDARETFAQRKLVHRRTHVAIGSVTFSGGVADAFGHGDQQAALKAADQALLQAKEQGRNRIVVAAQV